MPEAIETTADAVDAVSDDTARVADFVGARGMPETDKPAKPTATSSEPAADPAVDADGDDADGEPPDHRQIGADAHEQTRVSIREKYQAREAKRQAKAAQEDQREFLTELVDSIKERVADPAVPTTTQPQRKLMDAPEAVFEENRQQTQDALDDLRYQLEEERQLRLNQEAAWQEQQDQQAMAYRQLEQNKQDINQVMTQWDASQDGAGFLGEGGVFERWQEKYSADLLSEGYQPDQLPNLLLGAVNRFIQEGQARGLNGMHLLENHAFQIGVVGWEEPAAVAPAPTAATPLPTGGQSTAQAALAAQAAGQTGPIGGSAPSPVSSPVAGQLRTPQEYLADGISGKQLADLLIQKHGGDIDALTEQLYRMPEGGGAWGGGEQVS